TITRNLRRDRVYWLNGRDKKDENKRLSGKWISGHRSPALGCTIRIYYDLMSRKSHLLLDLRQYLYSNVDPWTAASSEPTPKKRLEKWRLLKKPLKEFTIHVGLKGTRRGRYQKARRIVEKNRLSKGAPQWFWRPIFVDPKNSTHYEVTFHLLLY